MQLSNAATSLSVDAIFATAGTAIQQALGDSWVK
jgi:hypothetical protein